MHRHHWPNYLAWVFLMIFLIVGCGKAQTSSPAAGQARTDAKEISQVWVPAGSFLMGTSDKDMQDVLAQNPPRFVTRALPSEQPQHEVRLSSGYWIDKYEVTYSAFQKFVDEKGYEKQEYWSEAGWKWLNSRPTVKACSGDVTKEKPNHPCVNVTWYEAEAYAHWRGGRLPTEAEWGIRRTGSTIFNLPLGKCFR